MALTSSQTTALLLEYMEGEVTDSLLCSKYGIQDHQLKALIHIGTGTLINPEPVQRGMTRGVRNAVAVAQLAQAILPPEDLQVSPLQAAETIEPAARESALFLNQAELSFANNVLRGMNATAAAAASFEIFNQHMANRKAAELLRSDHVAEYLASMNGKTLFAPVRNKAYLEAVLWQVIDRGLTLRQSFDVLTGKPVDGKCDYNWKAVVSASTLLARLKGWDGADTNSDNAESQRDRLRRLQANYTASQGNNNDE